MSIHHQRFQLPDPEQDRQSKGISRLSKAVKNWLQPDLLLVASIAFLAARASILDKLFPFGLAFYAVVTLRTGRRYHWLSLLAVVLGLATTGHWIDAAQALAFALYLALVSKRLKPRGRGAGGVLITYCGLLLVSSVVQFVQGPVIFGFGWYGLIVLVFTFALAAISYLLIEEGLPLLLAGNWKELPPSQALAVVFTLALAFAGLHGWRLAGVPVSGVAGSFLVMLMAYITRSEMAAAAGLIMGALSAGSGIFDPQLIGLYGLAGLLAGSLARIARWRKVWIGAGFGLGVIITGLALNDPLALNHWLETVAAGWLALVLCPASITSGVWPWLRPAAGAASKRAASTRKQRKLADRRLRMLNRDASAVEQDAGGGSKGLFRWALNLIRGGFQAVLGWKPGRKTRRSQATTSKGSEKLGGASRPQSVSLAAGSEQQPAGRAEPSGAGVSASGRRAASTAAGQTVPAAPTAGVNQGNRLNLGTTNSAAAAARAQLLTEAGVDSRSRLEEFSGVFRELARSFEQVTLTPDRRKAGSDPAEMIQAAASQSCAGCQLNNLCWQREFHQTYRGFISLFSRAESNGQVRFRDLEGPLRQRCIHPDRVTRAVNDLSDRFRQYTHWQQELQECRQVVATQLSGMAEIIAGLADQAHSEGPSRPKRPRYQLSTGVARLAKGSGVSGDSYTIDQPRPDQALLALSDGMGSGSRAALESHATLRLFRQLLETGFDKEVAIRTINAILLLRSPEDIFATLDLSLVDLASGAAEFVKVGAAPSFVKRGRQVQEITADALPIGIIQDIDVEVRSKRLRAGDYLVMLSDGLTELPIDTSPGCQWLKQLLKTTTVSGPKRLAEYILETALALVERQVTDDMTVLVARVDRVTSD